MKPSQVYTAIFLGMLSLGAFAQQAQNPQPHMPMRRQTSGMSARFPRRRKR